MTLDIVAAHNTATIFEHMKSSFNGCTIIIFFVKDGILYDNKYGYRKQYICANTMWLLSVLGFTYIVIRDTCINATCNGRRKIYGMNGSANKNSKYIFCIIGTE